VTGISHSTSLLKIVTLQFSEHGVRTGGEYYLENVANYSWWWSVIWSKGKDLRRWCRNKSRKFGSEGNGLATDVIHVRSGKKTSEIW